MEAALQRTDSHELRLDGHGRPDPSPAVAWSSRRNRPRRIAYFVSRFPTTTETFVLRELNAVAADPDVKADLFSLFPAPRGIVQAGAQPWLGRVQRPRPGASVRHLVRWSVRRPIQLISSIALIFFDHWRRPLTLLRALATVPIAAQHATALQRQGTDHVHAHFATYPALAAWLCWRLCGVPYSFTAHAHDLYMHQLGLERRAADAAFVVTISEFNRKILEELAPAGAPVHVVHCGVALDGYRYRPRAPKHEGDVRAICVAALRRKKGHKLLFEALTSDRPGLGRISVDVIGNGRLREELEEYAARLGLGERVRFHGNLTESDVAEKLDEADLFVLPSVVERSGDTEGIPVALMEAMAAGVPVVTSRITGVPELVRDRATGLLAEPGDVPDLVDKLVEVLENPHAARARAVSARALVEREFELNSSAERLLDLFEKNGASANGHFPAPHREGRRSRLRLMRPPLVLAYHAVGELPPALDPEGLMVPPDELRAQVRFLQSRNYEFVTSSEFAQRLHDGRRLIGLCALTFDDGSADNATILPGLLAELGVPATLFVCPGLLGVPHPWIEREAGVRLMNRAELEATASLDLIEIGSHTNEHADLAAATWDDAYADMASSKGRLEELIGKPVQSFAFPYGRYSAVCPAAAEAAGYTSAATCGLKGGWTPYELRRELIAPGDLQLRFGLKARGLYRPLVSSYPARARRRIRNEARGAAHA